MLQRASADNILRDLKANPDTWLQVVHILQNTRSTHTKYFALQVSFSVLLNLLLSSLYLAAYSYSHCYISCPISIPKKRRKADIIGILLSCILLFNIMHHD